MSRRRSLFWGAALGLPALLTAAFWLAKGNRAWMDRWVFGVLGPLEQSLGRIWSVLPCSGAECLVVLAVLAGAVWIGSGIFLWLRRKDAQVLLVRLLGIAAVGLWLWTGLCWLWNGAYYASTFAQRSGLDPAPYSVERLTQVTEDFAARAAALAPEMERDAAGHFQLDLAECFARGTGIYDRLEEEFPFLEMEDVAAKPMYLFSKIQSALGFTGVYFPFTGEANVNIDAPACLIPATIAHEMSHQRMIASEQEANFLGIAAAVGSDDPLYQYSGSLMGLIHLSNALAPADPQAWQEIAEEYFNPALRTDWNDNNAYWAQRQSAASDAAEQAYDAFLKGNDQELGYRSYGACVDLLVAYYGK